MSSQKSLIYKIVLRKSLVADVCARIDISSMHWVCARVDVISMDLVPINVIMRTSTIITYMNSMSTWAKITIWMTWE